MALQKIKIFCASKSLTMATVKNTRQFFAKFALKMYKKIRHYFGHYIVSRTPPRWAQFLKPPLGAVQGTPLIQAPLLFQGNFWHFAFFTVDLTGRGAPKNLTEHGALFPGVGHS